MPRKLIAFMILVTTTVFSASPEISSGQVKNNNEFAFQLYRQLQKNDGNLFFSPYSISAAMAITANGARGDTLKQIKETLHLSDDYNSSFMMMKANFNQIAAQKNIQLSIANSLWLQQNQPVEPSFTTLIEKYYAAQIASVNFSDKATRKTINALVSRQTKDKITNIISADTLNQNTMMVIINAVYFSGNWEKPFETENTKNAPFFTSSKRKISVPMMYQKDLFKYTTIPGAQLLEMPYRGKALSMLIILPESPQLLKTIEDRLGTEQLSQWLNQLEDSEVKVFFPKFRINNEFELKDTLRQLGIVNAFSNLADFSGINGKTDLSISMVRHMAFVAVDETGTEAAAATAVIVDRKLLPMPLPVFRASRPFIFIIRDRTSGSILFMGRMSEPDNGKSRRMAL